MSRTSRTFLVLEYLLAASRPPTHGELMRALELPRSTLSDLLRELSRLGYVEERDKRYRPGTRLLSFAHRGVQYGGLRQGIRPTLERLAAATRETAVYVIRVGDSDDSPGHVVAIDQVESPLTIRYVAELGKPYPLRTSTAGRAFLAFGEEPDARPPGDAIERELELVRERGYSLASDEARGTTMAAPAFDHQGSLVGAVCIIGPTERVLQAADTIWPALRDGLDELRRTLVAPASEQALDR